MAASTLSGHRVLIASLFLPNTVDLSPHNSPIATPVFASPPKKAPEPLPARAVPKKKLTSIVDDLAVKVRHHHHHHHSTANQRKLTAYNIISAFGWE